MLEPICEMVTIAEKFGEIAGAVDRSDNSRRPFWAKPCLLRQNTVPDKIRHERGQCGPEGSAPPALGNLCLDGGDMVL